METEYDCSTSDTDCAHVGGVRMSRRPIPIIITAAAYLVEVQHAADNLNTISKPVVDHLQRALQDTVVGDSRGECYHTG